MYFLSVRQSDDHVMMGHGNLVCAGLGETAKGFVKYP